MKRIIIIFLLLLLIPVAKVNGYYCKYSEIAKYKGLASNINATYSYIENSEGVTFTVTLVNMNKDLYIVDSATEKIYNFKGNNEINISGYKPGTTIKYNVYTTNKNCSDQLLYTVRVILPYFNPYYNDPICKGVENYTHCQKWNKNELTYEEFTKRVNQYKNELIKPPVIDEIIDSKNENLLLSIFLDFLLKYYYIILLAIILICSIIIYGINKKSDIYR